VCVYVEKGGWRGVFHFFYAPLSSNSSSVYIPVIVYAGIKLPEHLFTAVVMFVNNRLGGNIKKETHGTKEGAVTLLQV